MFNNLRCAMFGHKYNGDSKVFDVSIGVLGTLYAKQTICTRCGHLHTESTLKGNITYDNFLKACGASVDEVVAEDTTATLIYPSELDGDNLNVITNGKIRKPKTKAE